MLRLALCVLCLASGCVSQAKFDDLQRLYDDAQARLADRERHVGSLGASVYAAQARVRELQTEGARNTVELELLEKERQQLESEQRRMAAELSKMLEDRTELTARNAALDETLKGLQLRKAEADRRVAEFRNLLARFRDLIDARTLKVTLSEGRMVLQLPTDVLFDSGSAKLSVTGRSAIAQVTNILKEVPRRRYQVEGHTDNVPIHNARYASNWELAAARGLGVVRAMVEGGVDAVYMSAASFGEFHPVSVNGNEEGRQANRRIEIIVVPDLAMLPGYEELQRIVDAS